MENQTDPPKMWNAWIEFWQLPNDKVSEAIFGEKPEPNTDNGGEELKSAIVEEMDNINRIWEIEHKDTFENLRSHSALSRSVAMEALLREVSNRLCNESSRIFPIEWKLTGHFCSPHTDEKTKVIDDRIVDVNFHSNYRAVLDSPKEGSESSLIRRYLPETMKPDPLFCAHTFYRTLLEGFIAKTCRYGIKFLLKESPPPRYLSYGSHYLYNDNVGEQRRISISDVPSQLVDNFNYVERDMMPSNNKKEKSSQPNTSAAPLLDPQISPNNDGEIFGESTCSSSTSNAVNETKESPEDRWYPQFTQRIKRSYYSSERDGPQEKKHISNASSGGSHENFPLRTEEDIGKEDDSNGKPWFPHLDGLFCPHQPTPAVALIPPDLLVDIHALAPEGYSTAVSEETKLPEPTTSVVECTSDEQSTSSAAAPVSCSSSSTTDPSVSDVQLNSLQDEDHESVIRFASDGSSSSSPSSSASLSPPSTRSECSEIVFLGHFTQGSRPSTSPRRLDFLRENSSEAVQQASRCNSAPSDVERPDSNPRDPIPNASPPNEQNPFYRKEPLETTNSLREITNLVTTDPLQNAQSSPIEQGGSAEEPSRTANNFCEIVNLATPDSSAKPIAHDESSEGLSQVSCKSPEFIDLVTPEGSIAPDDHDIQSLSDVESDEENVPNQQSNGSSQDQDYHEDVPAVATGRVCLMVHNPRMSRMLKSVNSTIASVFSQEDIEDPTEEPTKEPAEAHREEAIEESLNYEDSEPLPESNISEHVKPMCRKCNQHENKNDRKWHHLTTETAIADAVFGPMLKNWTVGEIRAEMNKIVHNLVLNQKYIRDEDVEHAAQIKFGGKKGTRLAVGDVNLFVQKRMRTFFTFMFMDQTSYLIPDEWQELDVNILIGLESPPEQLTQHRNSDVLSWTRMAGSSTYPMEFLQERVYKLTKDLIADLIRTYFVVKIDSQKQVHFYFDGTFDKPYKTPTRDRVVENYAGSKRPTNRFRQL